MDSKPKVINEITKHEIIQLTQEALKLASAACHFDKTQNFIGACDYYDKCLLNIDEVLNKLAPNSDEWKMLLSIRSKYDDRMELLRENESSKFSLLKNDSKSASLKRSPRKRIHFSDDSYVVDNTGQSTSIECQPENQAEIPYWQLRNINRTIQDGGFLTNNIFIHKKIWLQTGTKFSGVTAKNAAFEIILQCVLNNVEGLYFCDDDDSLALAQTAFLVVEDELVALQNQLSKPFPFIKERGAQTADTMSTGSGHGSAHGPVNTTTSNSVSAGGDGVASFQSSPNSEKRNNNRSFATMVSTLGKNMKKYAELSYQRLVVALPSKMTAQDMRDYTTIVSKLCDKCQILDTWFRFLLKAKQGALSIQGESMEATPPVSANNSEPPSPTVAVYARSHIPPAIKTHIRTEFSEAALLHIDSMLVTLQTIASVIRSVVCEILLRDIEALVERYLLKTRKSFARMYWDDDVEYVD